MNKYTITQQEGQIIEIILKSGHRIVLTDNSLSRLRILQHGFEDRDSFINEGIKEYCRDMSELYDVLLLCDDHDLYEKDELIELMNIIRYAKQNITELAIPPKYYDVFESTEK